MRMRQAGAVVGHNVEVINLDRLRVGQGTVIQSNVTLHCGGMDWSCGRGGIAIGRNGFVGHGAVLYGAGTIEIGDDVLISPGVVIASHQHSFDRLDATIRSQPTRLAAVFIESDVWIGALAMILPGVRVGRGAVVAAGAVVTRDVAPAELVAGVPAVRLRHRSEPQVAVPSSDEHAGG
jgi:acetyltransferase-like isoleucine patch superfamily enzyme